jgi:hydroxyacylglutathione hydrolase
MVFTGDAVFTGSTGRTDLDRAMETYEMASQLYHSIYSKLLPLGDSVIIHAAHGAGSVCGPHIADRPESTLGIERSLNPSLAGITGPEFIKIKEAEKQEYPPYFEKIRRFNMEGMPPLGVIAPLRPLTPAEFETEMANGAVAVDTREPSAFGGAHIAGSYAIWAGGLPEFAGWILPGDKPLLLIADDPASLDKSVLYLRRLGFERFAGYLGGGIENWFNAGMQIEHLPLLSVHELKARFDRNEDPFVLDVRSGEEWEVGHINGAHHIFVGRLEENLPEVPKDKTVAVLCSVGRRSSIAASILLRAGYPNIYNVIGAMTAWKAAGYPVARR